MERNFSLLQSFELWSAVVTLPQAARALDLVWQVNRPPASDMIFSRRPGFWLCGFDEMQGLPVFDRGLGDQALLDQSLACFGEQRMVGNNRGQKAEINAPAKGLQDLQDGNRVILRSAEFLKALDTLENLHVVVGDGLVMFGLCFERSDFVLIENDWCFGF